jgi:GWxTD domain-containing protein
LRPVRVVVLLVCAAAATAPALHDPHAARLKKLSRKEVHARVESLSPLVARDVAAMQYILSPEELAVLLARPQDERCRKWIDAWWRTRDPIYTTPGNEALVEHERRVLTAENYFARGAWPGWDDRGEVFIRYGPPGSRSRQPADVVEPGIYVPALEYWYYPQFDMFAAFADPNGSGRYFFHMESVRLPAWERPLSDRRMMPSKYLADLPLDYLGFENDLPGALNLYPPFAEKSYDDFMKRVYRYYDVVEKTPAAYPFDFASMRIPMFFAVHSFRGGDGVDRVDVNTEFESSVTPLSGGSYARRFLTTSVFWDSKGNEIARHSRVDSIRTWSLVEDSVATVLNQTILTLPPGTYRMAVTVQESESGRFTSTRRVVGCHDMEGGLAMSDLALARSIGRAREASPFNRGPLEVVPRPSGHYRLGAPVPVYFEVYHLGQNADGVYAYTVEYAITPRSERPRSLWRRFTSPAEEPVQVRSRFDAAAIAPDDVVHVAASTMNLWPGEFTLEVTVTDGVSGRRVSRETSFHLLP